jgi:hypothetical protein
MQSKIYYIDGMNMFLGYFVIKQNWDEKGGVYDYEVYNNVSVHIRYVSKYKYSI